MNFRPKHPINKPAGAPRTGDKDRIADARLSEIFNSMDLGAFLVAYRKRFSAALRKKIPRTHLEDLMQTVYLKALFAYQTAGSSKNFFARFASPAKLKSWLATIAHNQYVSDIRHLEVSARNNKQYTDWMGCAEDPFAADEPAWATSNIDRAMCTGQLSGQDKQIMDMIFDGCSQSEIAKSLGLSTSTLSRLVIAAMKKMKCNIILLHKKRQTGNDFPDQTMHT